MKLPWPYALYVAKSLKKIKLLEIMTKYVKLILWLLFFFFFEETHGLKLDGIWITLFGVVNRF